jgi:N-acetyltransferase
MSAPRAIIGRVERPSPVTLTGEHVVLEPLERRHAAGIAAAADDETFRYMPLSPLGPGGVESYLDEALDGLAAGAYLPFAILWPRSGALIGSTRFGDIAPEHQRLEIGWTWLSAAARRTAANTEAKLLLLGHAFESLGASRVALKTDARNERSQRAIERLGAVREGVLRRHMVLPGGIVRDTVYYSILRDEWPAVRERLRARLARG